ncbi:MAG: hypothetical protein AB1744_10835 [Candidatus Zixiibacteriota bacterium]
MRTTSFLRAWGLTLVTAALFAAGCSRSSKEPPAEEIFEGKFVVEDLQEPDPAERTKRDQVRFTVKGTSYRIDHLIDSTSICGSGGRIGGFGTTMVRLTHAFVIPAPGCDSTRVPEGEFKSRFAGDSLILGPETRSFEIGGYTWSYNYTFRLTR